jgi:hypothetical protein
VTNLLLFLAINSSMQTVMHGWMMMPLQMWRWGLWCYKGQAETMVGGLGMGAMMQEKC